MRKLCKHLLVLAVIICCVVGVAINAQAEEIIDSGTCGDNLTWTLDNSGTLTIRGTGEMYDYQPMWNSNPPWFSYGSSITNLIITEGVTNIGSYVCYGCTSLTSITIPKSVISIGHQCFDGANALQKIKFHGAYPSISQEDTFDEDLWWDDECEECAHFQYYCIRDLTATIYYPADDPTWVAHASHNFFVVIYAQIRTLRGLVTSIATTVL